MSKKQKILFIGPWPNKNKMQGTYGKILKIYTNSEIFKDTIEFIPLRMTLPEDGNIIKRFIIDLFRFFSISKKDIIIAHYILQKGRSSYREFVIERMAKIFGIKIILDNRGGGLQYYLKQNNLKKILIKRNLKKADVLFMECQKDVEFLKNNYGFKSIYLPNCVNLEEFENIKPANLVRRRDNRIILIYSGRYSAEKGILVILESLDILSRYGVNAELWLTGEAKDKNINEAINKYVKTPPKGIKVINYGLKINDVYDLLSSAHIFLFPTKWYGEGHPNSINEAMVSGLPVIASDWIHRTGILPEEGSVILKSINPLELAEAIIYYVKNPDKLVEAGKFNREFVKNKFLDTTVFPEVLKYYLKLKNE